MKERPLFYLLLILLIPLTIFRIARERRLLPEVLAWQARGDDLTLEALVAERVEGAYETCYRLEQVTLQQGQESIACGALFASCEEKNYLPVGVRIRAYVRLRAFEPARNPGGFDEEAVYRAQGLVCRAFLSEVCVTGGEVRKDKEAMASLRTALGARIDLLLSEPEAGVAKAMLLGEKREADPEIRNLYADHGIAHILAISGLHIQLLGMGLWNLARRLGARAWAAAAAAGSVAFLYGMLTGFSVSCVRALIMFFVWLLGQCLCRSADTLTSAGIAAAVILNRRPMAVTGGSFVLSFGAVCGTALLGPVFRAWKVPEGLLASLSISLSLLPVLLLQYAVISPYSVLLNLAVLPLMSYLMGTLAAGLLLSFVWEGGGRVICACSAGILRVNEALCHVTDLLPGHLIVRGTPGAWAVAAYLALLGAGMLLLRRGAKLRGRKRRKLGLRGAAVLVLACLVLLVRPPHRGLEVVGIDVSQGDGFLIRMDETNVMIDGGSSDQKNVGSRVLRPVLRARGVDHLACAVITHWDSDHMNGILELLEEDWLKVDCVVLPAVGEVGKEMEGLRKCKEKLTALGVPYWCIGAGEVLSAERGELRCLYPQTGGYAENPNNASVVLGLHYGAFSMLFTGDLGGEREGDLLSFPGGYTVLKAMHHGSAYSNTPAMLAWCQPRACVVSCGRDNSYGHPHGEFLQRLRERGIPWYVTAECGAVIIESDGGSWEIRGWLSGGGKGK